MSKKTKADPTGQAGSRNKGVRVLTKRLGRAERRIKTLFRAVPKSRRRIAKIQNSEKTTFYDYELSPEGSEQLNRSIGFILNEELLETQIDFMPIDWYWKQNIELPYRQGTVEEVRDFNQLIAAAIVAGVLVKGLPLQKVPVERVIFSEIYRMDLGKAYVSSFSDIKTLSSSTAAKVVQRINAGISAGSTPTEIGAEISERFEVSKSSAKRIAETEVNKAYNDAKLDATDLMAGESSLKSGVVHISALTPTTRTHHAARHGNAYTVEDQRQWWDSGSNRINCKCTTRSILIDKRGKIIKAEIN